MKCGHADEADCNNETDSSYMMKAKWLDYEAWVWVPLCGKHEPPDHPPAAERPKVKP